MSVLHVRFTIICALFCIAGLALPAQAEPNCPSASEVQTIMGLENTPTATADREGCNYKLDQHANLYVHPGKTDTFSDIREFAIGHGLCAPKTSLGTNGLWCPGTNEGVMVLTQGNVSSWVWISNWTVDDDETEPRVEALAKLIILGIPVPKALSTSVKTQPIYDPKLGFGLQKGLWQLTTTVTPHETSEDQSGMMGRLLSRTRVAYYCSTGKPGDGMNAKIGSQGCEITVKPTSTTSTISDTSCIASAFGGQTKTVIHSEMKLMNAKHAISTSQSTISGIGRDSVTDANQEWVFRSQECGTLPPGETRQQQ